jgi:hypothetical protein
LTRHENEDKKSSSEAFLIHSHREDQIQAIEHEAQPWQEGPKQKAKAPQERHPF